MGQEARVGLGPERYQLSAPASVTPRPGAAEYWVNCHIPCCGHSAWARQGLPLPQTALCPLTHPKAPRDTPMSLPQESPALEPPLGGSGSPEPDGEPGTSTDNPDRQSEG